MSNYIITAIIALAAAKAKTQVKDILTKPKCREKLEGKRGVANTKANHATYELQLYKGQIPIPLTPVE
jgi:hypothetical protein